MRDSLPLLVLPPVKINEYVNNKNWPTWRGDKNFCKNWRREDLEEDGDNLEIGEMDQLRTLQSTYSNS